jgi:hypothetical protein
MDEMIQNASLTNSVTISPVVRFCEGRNPRREAGALTMACKANCAAYVRINMPHTINLLTDLLLAKGSRPVYRFVQHQVSSRGAKQTNVRFDGVGPHKVLSFLSPLG